MANEIISFRDSISKHFLQEDGKIEARIYSTPIHYKDEKNQWKDIDLTIKPNDVWEFEYAVLENTFRAYFNDKTDKNINLVSFEFANTNGDSRWINYKLDSATPIKHYIDNNRIVYEECFKDVDVEYVVRNNKLKENIILKNRTELNDFVFTLKMDGIEYEKNNEGYIIFTDLETGEMLWSIDAPFMLDADGNRSDGVEYLLGNNGEYDTLTVHVADLDFLETAKYPIVIDPTTTYQPNAVDGKDALVDAYNPGTTGGTKDLQTNSAWSSLESLIYFPLDFLNNGVVEKAEIRLWQKGNATGTIGTVGKITSNWDEATVTWNTKPTTDLSTTVPIHVPAINDWAWIDIKPLITKSNFLTNYYGFTMSYGGRDINGTYIYYSSDTAPDISKAPYLWVMYVLKPAIGFHDDSGSYYGDEKGNIWKYLNIGTLIAGQTSIPKKANIKNLNGFPIQNVRVWVDPLTQPSNLTIELSRSNNPFVPESPLIFNGVMNDNDSQSIYVRVITNENTTAGGNFDIMARADPY